MSEKPTPPESATCSSTDIYNTSIEGGHDNDRSETRGEEAPVIGERSIRGFRWIMAVFAILASTFMFALDTTVVANIQPHIINSVGEFEKYPWLGTAFVLPSATLVLPWSKAYSLFDVKWLYFANVALFEVGSAISGAAPTMNALIVGRAIAGVGGCGMYIGGLTFLSVVTTPKERPIYISLVTPVWGLGTVLGPLVGGAFAESAAGWRWGFYVNLVIYAAVAPTIFILPSLVFAPTMSLSKKLAKFDWLGLILFLGWGIAFIMALQFGGTVYAWDSASEITLWAFTGALAMAFVLSHLYHPFIAADDRYYPAHLLRNRKLGVLQLATFAAPGAVYIPIYYLPLYFQFARGEGAVQAAVRLLPFVFMIVALAVLNGYLMSKLGYVMPWFLAGGGLALAGAALMFTVDAGTSNAAIYGYSALLGVGGGCFLMSAFGCVGAVAADADDVFNAVGVLSVAQGLGIVFFVSVAGIVYQNLGVRYIAPYLPVDFAGAKNDVLAGASSAIYRSFSAEVRDAIDRAIVMAMSRVYTLSMAASALTAITAPLLGRSKVE
ncbi:hypothetical protein PG989_007282 [Apiospora arundinis]